MEGTLLKSKLGRNTFPYFKTLKALHPPNELVCMPLMSDDITSCNNKVNILRDLTYLILYVCITVYSTFFN